MKVALRDDDTSFFTEPGRLEAVYHDVWDRIPGRPRRDSARGRLCRQGDSRKVLGRRPRLSARGESRRWSTRCASLVKDGRVTIAQHGYTHEDYPDGHEFQAAPDLESRLARGQAYLERMLDTRIRVFVPPHNALVEARARRRSTPPA